MTNTQLAELFLLRLYDLAEAEGHGVRLQLAEIAAEFGVTDRQKVYNVAKFLQNRGLIDGRFAVNGGVRATITGEGAVFVEGGGETGVIREYREHPEDYRISIDQSTHFHGTISGSNIAVHSSEINQTNRLPPHLDALFSDIIATVRAETELSERHRNEHLNDVAALRAELQRQRPRRKIVNALVSHLGDLASISSLIIQVQGYLPQIPGLGG